MSQVCSLTGEELRRNEEARLEIQKLHDNVPVQVSSGYITQAMESAKKKLKIMKTIKQEMILEVTLGAGTVVQNRTFENEGRLCL